MINWFVANGSTLVISLVVLVLVALAVRSLYRQKKQGGCCKGSCGSCKGCKH